MDITFRTQQAAPDTGVAFFWMLKINPDVGDTIIDSFIPELFYDYLYVQEGRLSFDDGGVEQTLPQQVLKTLFNKRLVLVLNTPLVLYGARLLPGCAEHLKELELQVNALLEVDWISKPPLDLKSFASELLAALHRRQTENAQMPMLSHALEESDWLAQKSPRHKRRLYKKTFGMSRKELHAIQRLHTFLGQSCDFGVGQPSLIDHLNPEVFYDQPHFNRMFKKLTGLTPLEYFETSAILQENLMAVSYNGKN